MSSLIDFIEQSPTAWHACHTAKMMLKQAGFEELDEKKRWDIRLGKRYYVQRGASLCAFVMPKKKIERLCLFTSHTDSPSLRLRPHGESQKDGYSLLHFEIYGAPILPSWLGRALALAGKVIVKNKNGTLESKLVHIQEKPFVFPYVAFHLDRTVNDSFSVHKQAHFHAIVGTEEESLEAHIQKIAGDVIHQELYAVPLAVPTRIGKEMIVSYRLDNLVSFFAATECIHKVQSHPTKLVMSVSWNHEEIGSETYEGASSSFVQDVMNRIYGMQKIDVEDRSIIQASSLVVSLDVAHATHPNFAEKSDPHHPVTMGDGVAVKIHANQKYTSDAEVVAEVVSLFKQHDIAFQYYSHRNDSVCGSTVGPIYAALSGIQSMDIGAPVLSMHAAEELVNEHDVETLIQALAVIASS